jgi:hypothetical protein
MFLGKKEPRKGGDHEALGLPNAKTPETGASGVFKAMNSQVTRTMHRPVQPWNEAPSRLESRTLRLG